MGKKKDLNENEEYTYLFIYIHRATNVLVWLLNLGAVSGFMNWASIAFVQLRFRRGYVYQGRDIRDLPYKAFLYPYGSIISGTFFILVVLAQGYVSFYPKWNAVTFVSSYIGFIPLILAYVCHKIITKSKIVPLDEIGKVKK
jgi:lysine-specific permease